MIVERNSIILRIAPADFQSSRHKLYQKFEILNAEGITRINKKLFLSLLSKQREA